MLKIKTQLASLNNVLHFNPTYAPYSLTSLKMFLNEISAVNLMSIFRFWTMLGKNTQQNTSIPSTTYNPYTKEIPRSFNYTLHFFENLNVKARWKDRQLRKRNHKSSPKLNTINLILHTNVHSCAVFRHQRTCLCVTQD